MTATITKRGSDNWKRQQGYRYVQTVRGPILPMLKPRLFGWLRR